MDRIGITIGVIKGDTRSLDYRTSELLSASLFPQNYELGVQGIRCRVTRVLGWTLLQNPGQ